MQLNQDYQKSHEYWAEVPPTIDGVLGGFGFISDKDVEGSKLFIKSLLSSDEAPATNTALDCGAGIGRITKYLLVPFFNTVDIVEPNEKFINSVMDFVGEDKVKIGTLYKVGLQKFIPKKTYDVIWNQWVLGYLNDEDLWLYLIRCSLSLAETVANYVKFPEKKNVQIQIISTLKLLRNALNKSGLIIVKENVTSSGKLEKDETDSSVTRTLKQFTNIFKKAHLKRIKQCKQTNFPNGLYPVYMFALAPCCNYTIDETNTGSHMCEKLNLKSSNK